MVLLTKYRIYCNTESNWSEGWRTETEGPPTVCFNDSNHEVNPNSFQDLEVVDTTPKTVVIEESNVPENASTITGKFRCDGFSFTIPANSTGTKVVSWTYPISVMESFFSTKSIHDGDILNTVVGANTIIGLLTTGVSSGTSTFNVSSTVLQHIIKGYEFLINGVLIGIVISINTNNSTVTTNNSTTTTFATNSYIGTQVRTISNLTITNINNRYSIGSSKVGGMYLPANVNVSIIYTNKDLNNAKDFNFEVEYIY